MQPILDNFIFQFLEKLFSTLHPSLGNVNLGANARFPCVEKELNLNSFPKSGLEFTMDCYSITQATLLTSLTAPPFLSHLFCLAKEEGNYQYHPFL